MNLTGYILLGIYFTSIVGMLITLGVIKYRSPFTTFKRSIFWVVVLPVLNTYTVLDSIYIELWIIIQRKLLERKRRKNPEKYRNLGGNDIQSIYPNQILHKEIK